LTTAIYKLNLAGAFVRANVGVVLGGATGMAIMREAVSRMWVQPWLPWQTLKD